MKLSNFFLSTNASIVDCLKLFKKNHIGEAIITNKKKELLGVISESDIRNLIIQGFSKKNKINNIFNNNPIFLEAPFTNEKKIHPWLPEEKFSSICMLFFLFTDASN
jgi:predicted transcriptional regulator